MIVNYTTKSGLVLDGAFISVSTILVHSHFVKIDSEAQGSNEFKNNDIECHFDVYVTQSLYESGYPPVESFERVYPYDEEKPAKEQALELLSAELAN